MERKREMGSGVGSVLSLRMRCVASMVTKGNRVADIGCDHAYTSIYLVTSGIAPSVIAMDVREGPLSRARTNVMRFHVAEQVELRLSDGLQRLSPLEADTILMAGMGGLLITELLRARDEVTQAAKELILQPQSDVEEVRRYLHSIGFCIRAEQMVYEDGKYYVVIAATHGSEDSYTKTEYRYGRCLMEEASTVFLSFLHNEEEKMRGLLSGLAGQTSGRAVTRAEELRQRLMEVTKLIGRNNT